LATLYKGVFFLAASAFLGESIEFLINMILARELGKHGLGLYMSILPSIYLVVLLSSFELQVSISKFIAEKEGRYHRSILHHAITIAIVFTAILLLLTTGIIPFVPVFNAYHPYTRWLVILLIPVICFTSVARGYFMGKQQMGKIAISNFFRKIFQLAILFFVFRLFQFEIKSAVLIAIATFIGSEIVVFAYLIFMFITQFQQIKRQPFSNLNRQQVRKNLMAVSIPTTMMRLFSAITNAIQPFLIKQALIRSGMTATIATEQYGMLAGVALTIGFFPAFLAHSLMTVLIPAVSKAYSSEDLGTLRKMLNQVIKFTFLYGIPAVAAFYILARPLTSLFFHSSTAAGYLQMLWPCFLFYFFIIPMQAFLIGLGLIKDIFIQTVWATIVSYSVILWLGSIPEWRMNGVIVGMNVEAVLLAFMNYLTVCKKIGVSMFMKGLVHKTTGH
jgi:stage V sporulation protein B